MYKSIRVKLFLTLLLTTLIVVVGMHAFMRVSFERGFMLFIESRQQERIDNLAAALTEYYQHHLTWHELSQNKKRWLELLFQANARRHHSPPPWINEALIDPSNSWPPKPPDEHKPNSLRHLIPLEMRIMLLDSDKTIIYGRQEALDELTLTPIYHGKQTVGFLGVLPGTPINQSGEIQFMEDQAEAFIGIAALMVLLSAGLALPLAYLLGRPLKRITAASKALAVGDYHTRLPVDSNDELGQLACDFNELAAALAQAEQSRQRWVQDISHELRTPLSVLRGELEALQDGVRPLTLNAVDSLYGDVMRLNRLADDLYQLSLSDQGALSYHKHQLDPELILQDDINAFAAEFARRNLSLSLDNRLETAVTLYADPDRLSQLFRNLLNNSLNYTDGGGQLLVSVQRANQQLLIHFDDSAPSIPEPALAKLFDRFYRVETSRNRNSGGAGLGLAICRNIISAHHGSINATLSALGGVSIRIALPIQP